MSTLITMICPNCERVLILDTAQEQHACRCSFKFGLSRDTWMGVMIYSVIKPNLKGAPK